MSAGIDNSDSPPGMQDIISAFELTQKQNSKSDACSPLQWNLGEIQPIWSLSEDGGDDTTFLVSVPVISQSKMLFFQPEAKPGRKSAIMDSRCRLLVCEGAADGEYVFCLSWRIRRGSSKGLSEKRRTQLFSESFSGVEVIADMEGKIREASIFKDGTISSTSVYSHDISGDKLELAGKDFLLTIMDGIGVARVAGSESKGNQTKSGSDTLNAAVIVAERNREDSTWREWHYIMDSDSLKWDEDSTKYDGIEGNYGGGGSGGGLGGFGGGEGIDSSSGNGTSGGGCSYNSLIKPNSSFSNLSGDKCLDVSNIKYPGIDKMPNCFDCANYMLAQVGLSIGDYYKLYQEPDPAIDLPQSKRLSLSDGADPVTAANIIFDAIDKGDMIVAGVDYHYGNPGNDDKTTDHWIIIYGYEYLSDSGDYIFTYIETGRYLNQASNAFNMELYYDVSEGTTTGLKWGKTRNVYRLTSLRYSVH